MKKILLHAKVLVGLLGLGLLTGCLEQSFEPDSEPPAVPRGVTSTTGDRQVVISWYPNAEYDLSGYHVYRGNSEHGNYFRIGTPLGRGSTTFADRDVTNGRTYYYAVAAFDNSGNESELSYDLVFDTPRPAGYGVRLFDFKTLPSMSAYSFGDYRVQDYRAVTSDIFFEYHPQSGGLFINVANKDTDLQGFGYLASLDDIDYAPEKGWSPLGYVECIAGHGYVIWTADNHFAKIRVTAANPNFVEFDWAYQIAEGNPELRVHPQTPEKAALLQRVGKIITN
jgi:hypothetical protein